MAPVTEVPSARLEDKYPAQQQRRALPDPPSTRYAELKRFAPARIVLPRLDTKPLIDEDEREIRSGERRIRGGVVRPVKILLEKDGEWIDVEPGTRVWRVEIVSPEARGLRLHLANVALGSGSQLFIYDGATTTSPDVYESSNIPQSKEIFSSPTTAETVTVELVQKGDAGSSKDTLEIIGVGHLYRGVTDPTTIVPAGACNLDASCYPDWGHVGDAVGRTNYISGQYIYYCSGALINNSSGDFSPLFLTAAHCGMDSTTAASVNILWKYKTSSCNGPENYGPSTSGARFLATSSASDSTLLELTGSLPDGLTWAGWSLQAPPVGGAITGIHHPETSYRRISFGNTISDDPNHPDFHSVRFSSGTVEPGSSGSPLFNDKQEIIGQLFGGNASCGNPNGATIYGKLATSYPQFKDANGSNYLESGLGDDALFPNQTKGTATQIANPGTIDNLVLRISAEDWFKITVPPNQKLGYTVAVSAGSFASVELYRGDETTPVSTNSSGGELKFLNDSGTNQDFYIRVFLGPFYSGTRSRYSLSTHLYTATPPDFANIFVSALSFASVRAQVYYSNAGWPVQFSVQYGKDASFTSFQQTQIRSSRDPFMGGDSGPIYTFTSLDPGATYYFRPVISNIAGTLIGAVQAFTVPAFLAPQIYGPFNGSTGIPAQFTLNWAPDYSDVPFDVYFGTVPDPPFVLNTFNIQYSPFAWNQHAAYSSKYYWRVAHTYKGVTVSSPVQSFTTELGPQIGVSASPFNFGAWIFSDASGTLTVTNTGSTWYMLSFAVTGGFDIQNNCGIGFGGLNPGSSCQVTVTKNHVSMGTFTGALSIVAHSIFSPDPIATTAVPVQLQVTDLVLSVVRPVRSHRGAGNSISAGQTAAYRVTLSPSGAVSGTALLGCSGAPAGVSCQVQPSTANLNGAPVDINVVVAVAADASQRGRALRLRKTALSETTQSKSFNLNVTATIGAASRTVEIPVTITTTR